MSWVSPGSRWVSPIHFFVAAAWMAAFCLITLSSAGWSQPDTGSRQYWEGFYDGEPPVEGEGGGEGEGETPPVPIGISTIEDLQKIGNDPNYPKTGSYYLTQDIDASSTASWNSGEGFAPIASFTGELDGQGYAIRGLVIDRPSQQSVGLFGNIGTGGHVSNLQLTDGSVRGEFIVGGLAGSVNGQISNCRVAMKVCGIGVVGGVAGFQYGAIERVSACGRVLGMACVGGLAAYSSCTITDSYSQAVVSGMIYVGGICGNTSGHLVRCYVAGPVEAWLRFSGGLAGEYDSEDAVAEASFWDKNATGQTEAGLGQGLLDSEMYQTSTYSTAGWDLETVWAKTPDTGYPYLRGIDPAPGSTTYTLEITEEGNGSKDKGISEKTAYDAQSIRVESPNPAPGFRFVGWRAEGFPDVGIGSAPLHLVMNQDWHLTAVYAPEWIEINSMEDWQKIGNDPAYPLRGGYVLTGDLDASGTATWNDGKGFEPIGPPIFEVPLSIGGEGEWLAYPFLGEFDGNGHTVTGLHIARPDESMVGLWRYTGTGSLVHDLSFEEVAVTGGTMVGLLAGVHSGSFKQVGGDGAVAATKGYLGISVLSTISIGYEYYVASAGGISGENWNGTMENCWATGTIHGGTGNVGGLTGRNDLGEITGCWARCTVTDGSDIGGLVGINYGSVARSFANGVIGDYLSGTSIGGLIGYNCGQITDSYAVATECAYRHAGGLAGKNQGTIARCYAAGLLNGTTEKGGLIGHTISNTVSGSFWDQDALGCETILPPNWAGTGKTTGEMMQAATFASASWDFNTCWEITEGQNYPRLRGVGPDYGGTTFTLTTQVQGDGQILISPDQASYAPNSVVILTAQPDNGKILGEWRGDGLPGAEWSINPLVLVMDRDWDVTGYFIEKFKQLASVEDLQRIGNEAGWPLSADYIITQDIDASGTAAWKDGEGFIPIGSDMTPFTGSLDGQGHTIHGLTVKGSSRRGGLIAAVEDGGRISNLSMEATVIDGPLNGGVLAGINRGTIYNCHISGSFNGVSFAGGIAGINYGLIEYCQSSGAWTASANSVGGISGANYGTIRYCCANGTVTGTYYVGGLVGYNQLAIANCCAQGTVNGSNNSIGGLAGANVADYYSEVPGSINQCCSMATVTAPSAHYVGGLVGHSTGEVNDSYAGGDVNGEDYVGGIAGGVTSAGKATRCYAVGAVQGISHIGGLVGYVNHISSVTNAFWDQLSTGQTNSAAGTASTTAAMIYAVLFTDAGWDFSTVWAIDEGQGYPYLKIFADGCCLEPPVEEGEGVTEGVMEGQTEGIPEGTLEGQAEGEGEGLSEGQPEGIVEGEGEGGTEGQAEGGVEGEGEGGMEGQIVVENPHGADQDANGQISLSELLRVIQFFNLRAYACAPVGVTTEDGYMPGAGADHSCTPHTSDYAPQDWQISLSELLRLIQFFNLRGYHYCPGLSTEDGYCPGA